MALFNRKKADTTTLPEVEKYYVAEKRERMGLAWLLVVVSIACIALLLIGAYFGGRWVYRKASHTDKTQGVVATVNSGREIGASKDKTTKSPETTKTPATPQTPVATPKPEPTPTPKTIPTPAPSTSAPVVPANNSTKLANTGPENTIAVFIISVVSFTALHSFISARSVRKS